MNKRTLLGAAALLAVCAAPTAQVAAQGAPQYSYITDRTFTSPDQLMGYDFKPARRELSGGEPEEIPVGKYSFGVTQNNLYVEGPGIRGVYSVNQTDQTEYGFLMKTMNARDPTIQGHLKIVTDDVGYVEGLIFKRSNDDDEVMFFLRVIPPEVDSLEAEYFTDLGEEQIHGIDSLWTDVEVRPFFRVYQESGVQQRVAPADSVYINFYKVVTVEERERGAMAALGLKKSGKRRRASGANVEEAIAALPSEPLAMEGGATAADAAAARAMMLATLQAGEQAGAPADSSSGPANAALEAALAAAAAAERANAVARDSAARRSAPDSTLASVVADEDPGLTAPDSALAHASADTTDAFSELDPALALARREFAASIAHADSAAAARAAAAAVRARVDSIAAATKLKVVTEFFVDINAYTQYSDGSSAMKHKTFNVHSVTERENGNSRAGGDRYQWELELDHKRTGYIYLDEYYRVNSIELDGQTFHMRGT